MNAAGGDAGMTYPAAVNVAVAVAMDDGGLITPVLAGADRTDLYSLSRHWADLVSRSRSKQLKPEEYTTGTFTLSNLGMFGVDRFDAILAPRHRRDPGGGRLPGLWWWRSRTARSPSGARCR